MLLAYVPRLGGGREGAGCTRENPRRPQALACSQRLAHASCLRETKAHSSPPGSRSTPPQRCRLRLTGHCE